MIMVLMKCFPHQCYLANPDVSNTGSIQDETIIAIQALCLWSHFHGTSIILACSLNMEKLWLVRVVSVMLTNVAEAASMTTREHDHFALEHTKEMGRLVALNYTNLDGFSVQLVINVYGM